jgi:cytoskeletal protein CcmA (bactofilin family)
MKYIKKVSLLIPECTCLDGRGEGVLKNKINIETKKIDTVIGKETSMKGTLEAKGIIRIEGAYEGEIITQSDIIVGENAVVKANVKCSNITLAGRLEGKITAGNKFDIRSSGVMLGDVSAAVLSVEEGAFFSGNCQMEIKEERTKPEMNPVRLLKSKSSSKAEGFQGNKKNSR